jgi:hypothetical protein
MNSGRQKDRQLLMEDISDACIVVGILIELISNLIFCMYLDTEDASTFESNA